MYFHYVRRVLVSLKWALKCSMTIGRYNNSMRCKEGLNLYVHFTLDKKTFREKSCKYKFST